VEYFTPITVVTWCTEVTVREDQAELKRGEWMAKGSPPCQHVSLKLLYTLQNYFTGDYVCVDCGEVVGKVSPNK
jgi:hypothetical protein